MSTATKAELQQEAEARGLTVPPGATKAQLKQLLADNPAQDESENPPGETDPATAPPDQPEQPTPGVDDPPSPSPGVDDPQTPDQPGEAPSQPGQPQPAETPAADPGQPASSDAERDKADESGPVEGETDQREPVAEGSPAAADDRSLEEQAEAQSEVASAAEEVRREEQEAHDADADALDREAVENEVEAQEGLTMLVPGYVAVVGHRTDDQGLVRPTDLNRRSDRDVVPGRFCRIAEGDHQGRYGVLMDVKGPPDDDGFPTVALVLTRDDLHEDLVVGYDQLAPANPGGR